MLGYLADIASDLSVFHRVDDAGQMEAAVFFSLATRLPAYEGVLAARWRNEAGPSQQRGSSRGSGRGTYEAASGQANIASTAASAPPATRTQLMALNSQLGGNFFSTAVVKKGG